MTTLYRDGISSLSAQARYAGACSRDSRLLVRRISNLLSPPRIILRCPDHLFYRDEASPTIALVISFVIRGAATANFDGSFVDFHPDERRPLASVDLTQFYYSLIMEI